MVVKEKRGRKRYILLEHVEKIEHQMGDGRADEQGHGKWEALACGLPNGLLLRAGRPANWADTVCGSGRRLR